jgi:hypothetical protein
MIIYRVPEQTASCPRLLLRLGADLHRLERSCSANHEQVQELLIEFGELEAAIADALFPEVDSINHIAQEFRQAALLLGHVFYRSWKQGAAQIKPWLERLRLAIDRLALLHLPKTVQMTVCEGYAHYGLYPETYVESTIRFFRDARPPRAVCIGLRSIGTSLSAVVGATLQELGCEVRAYTVRPRGHPFDRRLLLSPPLEAELRSLPGAHFLIIDEGPGLSGSSLACVAQRLSELGVPDHRITIFPSWEPDGESFLSETAQARWRRHKKYTTNFQQVWLESGRLISPWPNGRFLDLSAGNWRALFYRHERDYPAVQPQHERRKYLWSGPSPPPGRRTPTAAFHEAADVDHAAPVLFKFAGLGRYGRSKLARAQQLADARFAPPALGLANGIMRMRFIPGRPLSVSDVNQELLDRIAHYLAHLRETFPAARAVPYEELVQMIRINAAEAFGDRWADTISRLSQRQAAAVCDSSTVAIDGRMLPHEWISTTGGYFKVDGTDHHNDHFFPSCQDIAWDVAGTLVEFALTPEAQDYFLGKYQSLAQDRTLMERLPFYRLAYISYRLGYATHAGGALGSHPDAPRFKSLVSRYSFLLRQAIGGLAE